MIYAAARHREHFPVDVFAFELGRALDFEVLFDRQQIGPVRSVSPGNM